MGDSAIAPVKDFPHLSAAPLVEAVIHWRARAEREWRRDELQAELARRLKDYPNQKAQHEIQFALEAKLREDAAPPVTTSNGGWVGWRCSSSDELNVAQFKRDGFVFSRLSPYQGWQTFEGEAKRLWAIFVELAAPSEVSRLGVRFINRIPIAADKELSDYLNDPPTCVIGQLTGFLYQSQFEIPGEPLGANVVKTMQEPEIPGQDQRALILDIDAFTRRTLLCGDPSMDEFLSKLRWLKNEIFFGLLNRAAIPSFQGAG